MNLEILRGEKDNLSVAVEYRLEKRDWHLYDQEVLNYCFSTRTLKLDGKFNVFAKIERESFGDELCIQRKIYHYINTPLGQGIGLCLEDKLNRLWMDYFMKTPWFEVFALINNIGNFFDKFCEELGKAKQNLLINVSAVMSGKIRVFVLDEEKATEWIKKKYFLHDDEEIFIYGDETSFQKLIDEMNASRDQKIFFVRVGKFIEPLKNAGFVEGRDFFNHYSFFSPNLLTQANFYSLIQAV